MIQAHTYIYTAHAMTWLFTHAYVLSLSFIPIAYNSNKESYGVVNNNPERYIDNMFHTYTYPLNTINPQRML